MKELNAIRKAVEVLDKRQMDFSKDIKKIKAIMKEQEDHFSIERTKYVVRWHGKNAKYKHNIRMYLLLYQTATTSVPPCSVFLDFFEKSSRRGCHSGDHHK